LPFHEGQGLGSNTTNTTDGVSTSFTTQFLITAFAVECGHRIKLIGRAGIELGVKSTAVAAKTKKKLIQRYDSKGERKYSTVARESRA